MLKSLFDGTALKKERQRPLLMEKTMLLFTKEQWDLVEGKVSSEKYENLIKARNQDRKTFLKLLNCVNKVEPTFGKPFFKVEIDEVELDRIRQKLNGR